MSSDSHPSGLRKDPPGSDSLRRSMGLAAATSMVVGIIVGASIFVQPSEVTRLAQSGRGVVLVWLASGVLTLCAALVCAELASIFPETGGVYVFLKRIYSPPLAFLWGWADVLDPAYRHTGSDCRGAGPLCRTFLRAG